MRAGAVEVIIRGPAKSWKSTLAWAIHRALGLYGIGVVIVDDDAGTGRNDSPPDVEETMLPRLTRFHQAGGFVRITTERRRGTALPDARAIEVMAAVDEYARASSGPDDGAETERVQAREAVWLMLRDALRATSSASPCEAGRCVYAEDVGLPEHACANGCEYAKRALAAPPAQLPVHLAVAARLIEAHMRSESMRSRYMTPDQVAEWAARMSSALVSRLGDGSPACPPYKIEGVSFALRNITGRLRASFPDDKGLWESWDKVLDALAVPDVQSELRGG